MIPGSTIRLSLLATPLCSQVNHLGLYWPGETSPQPSAFTEASLREMTPNTHSPRRNHLLKMIFVVAYTFSALWTLLSKESFPPTVQLPAKTFSRLSMRSSLSRTAPPCWNATILRNKALPFDVSYLWFRPTRRRQRVDRMWIQAIATRCNGPLSRPPGSVGSPKCFTPVTLLGPFYDLCDVEIGSSTSMGSKCSRLRASPLHWNVSVARILSQMK